MCARKEASTAEARAAAGFTLLEIMVALGMLGLLMSALYGSYRAVADSILGIRPKIALDQRGRAFMQQFSRQVRCCYGGRLSEPNQPVLRRDRATTDVDGYNSLFAGGGTSHNEVLLHYVTSSGTRTQRGDPGCLIVVSYRLDVGRRILEVREDPYGRPSKEDKDTWRIALEDVLEIELEYFDGQDWQSEWDSAQSQGLPRATSVKLLLGASPDEGIEWKSVIPILCSGSEGDGPANRRLSTEGRRPNG